MASREKLVFRQPFPGPGLGIRIIGEVNAEKVRIVQDADYIYRDEVDKAAEATRKSMELLRHGCRTSTSQPSPTCVPLVLWVMREPMITQWHLRAVNTIDFMTAEVR